MMSGSWVVGRVRILDDGFGGAGGKVGTVSSRNCGDCVVVGFLGGARQFVISNFN